MTENYIRFQCEACGKKLKALTIQAGKHARCSCGKGCVVPGSIKLLEPPTTQMQYPLVLTEQPLVRTYNDIWEEQDERLANDWSWVPITLLSVIAVVTPVSLVILLVKAPPDTRIAIGCILLVVFILCLASLLVARKTEKPYVQGMTVVGAFIFKCIGILFIGLAGIFIILFIVFGKFNIRSGSWYTTLRPLNQCGYCGHTWYPRGTDYSPRCPFCRRER